MVRKLPTKTLTMTLLLSCSLTAGASNNPSESVISITRTEPTLSEDFLLFLADSNLVESENIDPMELIEFSELSLDQTESSSGDEIDIEPNKLETPSNAQPINSTTPHYKHPTQEEK